MLKLRITQSADQFVADLYATLTRGCTLGGAVTLGRKQLAASLAPSHSSRGSAQH